MGLYMTEEWLREYCAKHGRPLPREMRKPKQEPEAAPPAKPAKYRNKKTTVDGIEFDSLHEAQVYQVLKTQWLNGEYRGLMCQVPFLLPGGVKYYADFVTLNRDGTYTVFDAKSEATRKDKTYRIKKRQMKNCLEIEIQEV